MVGVGELGSPGFDGLVDLEETAEEVSERGFFPFGDLSAQFAHLPRCKLGTSRRLHHDQIADLAGEHGKNEDIFSFERYLMEEGQASRKIAWVDGFEPVEE